MLLVLIMDRPGDPGRITESHVFESDAEGVAFAMSTANRRQFTRQIDPGCWHPDPMHVRRAEARRPAGEGGV